MAWNKAMSRYDELFENEKEKATAFDQLSERFYAGNFGTMAKSDIETLMFHLYIERCLEKKLPYDDYLLSRELGITQSRIRSLKMRKELQYPYEKFEWKEAFISCISNAHYDSTKKLIKVHIPDVNVLAELRNHLEQHGWYDEYQLNPKLFQCKDDIFFELCRSLGEQKAYELDSATEERVKKLKKEAKRKEEQSAIERILSGSAEDGMKELILGASKELLPEVLKLFPFGGLAGEAIKWFIRAVERT